MYHPFQPFQVLVFSVLGTFALALFVTMSFSRGPLALLNNHLLGVRVIVIRQLFGPRCQVKLNFQLYWRLHCFHCLQFAHSGGPESETMSISSLIELNTLRGDHCLRFQLIIAPSSNGHRCLLSLPNQFWNREAWAINQPWLHLHFGLLNSIH